MHFNIVLVLYTIYCEIIDKEIKELLQWYNELISIMTFYFFFLAFVTILIIKVYRVVRVTVYVGFEKRTWYEQDFSARFVYLGHKFLKNYLKYIGISA